MSRYNFTYRYTEKHSERHIEITADGQVTLCTNTYYKGWSYIHRPTDKLAEGQCVLFHTDSQTYKVKKNSCIHGMTEIQTDISKYKDRRSYTERRKESNDSRTYKCRKI